MFKTHMHPPPTHTHTGKARRLTLLECPSDLPSMMDAAKAADLVLLLVDGAFGFEMETFEFLNLLQVPGGAWGLCGAGLGCVVGCVRKGGGGVGRQGMETSKEMVVELSAA